MKNLHLKNLKDNNIEQIKKTNWFKQFNPEQQYYIESGIKNNVDITSFAKKEIPADDLYNTLTDLDVKKYGKILTKSYFDWYNYYPKSDIDNILEEITNTKININEILEKIKITNTKININKILEEMTDKIKTKD